MRGGDKSRDRERQVSRACADLENLLPGVATALQLFDCAFGEQLGFRTGNEHIGGHADAKTHEVRLAEDILQRLACQAALEQGFEARKLVRRQRPVELQVQVESGKCQDVREEEVDGQPRFIEPFRLQIVAPPLKERENGPLLSGVGTGMRH